MIFFIGSFYLASLYITTSYSQLLMITKQSVYLLSCVVRPGWQSV